VWLSDGAREAVHALKYGGLPRIAEDLAAAIAAVSLATDEASVLVPIPLAPKRLRQRGYNQSDVLARALSRFWKIPVVDTLIRSRETATQTALTPETRLANVAGAFRASARAAGALTPGWQPGVNKPWPHLVLVDDVFTTGATLAEAARALEQAGARTIYGVTFGRAVIPNFT